MTYHSSTRYSKHLRYFVLIGMSVALCFQSSAAHNLEPDLRARVDELKAEAQTQETTFSNMRTRAAVVWEWANAVAMTGEHIPINLTLATGRILTAESQSPAMMNWIRSLDRYIYELTLRDENPGGLGSLTIDAPEASPALSWQTIEVTYTVGAVPMEENGRLLLARQFMQDRGYPQRNDPAADNYVSIRCSNPDASFEIETFPWLGPHGGFRGPSPTNAYRLKGTSLSKGETITLVLGDKSGGSRGYQMQSFSNDACPIPIYVNLEENDYFVSMPIPTYRVTGSAPFAVQGFAPSIVKTGEPIIVSVRTEDRFANKASGPIPGYTVTLNGEAYGELPAGPDAISLMDVTLDAPGVYRFAYASTDGPVTGTSNPIWVQDNPAWRVYWGETHGHSGFAEGQGSIDAYFQFGRDEARLDYICLSEHDIWLDDFEWKRLNETSQAYTVENEFIVYPGYEWSAPRQRGGHHNVFFREPGHAMVSTREAPKLSRLFRLLHAENDSANVLTIPHAHQLGDWRTSDAEIEQLVEIMSGHGTFEWFGKRYLANGHRVGFVGASDDHVGHPGYAAGRGFAGRRSNIGQFGGLGGVIASEKTSDAIFDALRARNAYATSHSQRIILDVNLNGGVMGSQLPFSDSVTINGTVMGTDTIDTVDVIKNGEVVWTREFAGANFGSTVDLQLSFDSDSDPLMRDTPRGFRIWKGYVDIKNASINSIKYSGKLNPAVDFFRRSESDPNRVEFDVATRGLINGLIVSLSGASKRTEAIVHLEQVQEGGRAPRLVRLNAQIPSADVIFSMNDIIDGGGVQQFQVGRYTDSMRLRVVDPDGEMDQTFEFEETNGVHPGDYYYVRVRQLDGALAWSSPFWVGGEEAQ